MLVIVKNMFYAASDRPRCAIVGVAILAFSAYFLGLYLRLEPIGVSRIVVFALSSACWINILAGSKPTAREILAFGTFSLLFDAALVLGYHIMVDAETAYTATKDEAFISDYSFVDAVAFFGMIPALFVSCLGSFRGIAFLSKRASARSILSAVSVPTEKKPAILLGVLLFLAWSPYLFAYYPGLIFGDTLSSLAQVFGFEPLSNHHPVLYTLFIGFCVKAANVFGFGTAAGCALYCVIQMSLLAVCISYLVFWIVDRLSLGKAVSVAAYVLAFGLFGITPYFATYSIAMWKDPLFSISLVMITLFVADVVVFKVSVTRPARMLAFGLASCILVFGRNNGIYILILVTAVLAFSALFQKRVDEQGSFKAKHNIAKAMNQNGLLREATALAFIGCVVTVAYLIAIGPVFNTFGVVESSNAEGLGVPLNQMARVAAYGGEMTEGDAEYLDSILPLDLYESTYTPCCTDMLKWDESFNAEALSDGIWGHWLSMLVRNPMTYFEAWELQTFGFWTVNNHAVDAPGNISGAGPRTASSVYSDGLEAYGMDPSLSERHQTLRSLLPLDEGFISIGAVFWLFMYLACCMMVGRKTNWLIVLVPSFALMATLFAASPIWYWQRYAVAIHYLIPFYLAMLYWLGRQSVGVAQQEPKIHRSSRDRPKT